MLIVMIIERVFVWRAQHQTSNESICRRTLRPAANEEFIGFCQGFCCLSSLRWKHLADAYQSYRRTAYVHTVAVQWVNLNWIFTLDKQQQLVKILLNQCNANEQRQSASDTQWLVTSSANDRRSKPTESVYFHTFFTRRFVGNFRVRLTVDSEYIAAFKSPEEDHAINHYCDRT